MKKFFFIALASLFSIAAMAAKPATSTTVKEKQVLTVPADAKVKKQKEGNLICVTVEYSDGSSITVCCSNCIIIIYL